jgi:23S rRNA pseudouridine1911/1915/1917 synthase
LPSWSPAAGAPGASADFVVRHLTADRGDAGGRLDLMLCRHLTGVDAATRTRIQAWISAGVVTINGHPITRPAARVAHGDRVSVPLTAPVLRPPMAAENLDLAIIFEDEHLIAVDKPAGMVVHPTYRNEHHTLMNGLLWHGRGWPAPQRPSIVGRLDKLTSGLVVVAKTAAAHAALQRSIASPRAGKFYLALVYGSVDAPQGSITLGIEHDRFDRRRMTTTAGGGAPSLTRFERLSHVSMRRAGLTLLRCRLVTGRTHQIRVHLSASGWPIVGDPVYGEPRWSDVMDPGLAHRLRLFPRQALHASRLTFLHPMTGAVVDLTSALPEDLQQLLDWCGLTTQ